jgi:hypothetical protein
MKIADYHKRRRALEMSGALAQPNREKNNAHEDHEVRPEDVQGRAREGGPEGQGEGRSPGEEGAQGEVKEPAHSAYDRYGSYTDWKNYAGLPMPEWRDLPPRIRNAWRAAVEEQPSFEPEPKA